MNKIDLELRRLFLPIAVVEHHQLFEPKLSTYDISDRLGAIWKDIQKEAQAKPFTLDADCILAINQRIAKSFDTKPGAFLNRESWPEFIEACGDITEDPAHVSSWIFSSLYWKHLTHFKLATAWIFINILRLQHGFPEYSLSLGNLGAFLDSLSASGPPIYDGQTFYPEDYS